MLLRRKTDVQARCGLPASLALVLVLVLLLFSPCSLSGAHRTTVEHDFHIVHNVDNRSPEIDPFWMLELLFNSLRNKENLDKVLQGEDRDWLP
ncbi:prolactin releasing hormone 2 isoform X2 [Phyllopteryx taeniolatus]|uniref:prolactin releasing hormone 2 isoform X2 n=1 Tax=Phyllopteryx taeniolatus TaxID=161469 RepID=UPI002AD381CF|nr:prolactin releasing hormone 2 isoform X2 [Phyllopteryx taeniolatus]